MDEKETDQSFDEEFAPEISPGYQQDIHKPPKYKNASFLMGITIFSRCITRTHYFRLFLRKGDILYEETRFKSLKKNCENGKRICRRFCLYTETSGARKCIHCSKRTWSTK